MKNKLGYDDSLDVFGIHGVAGMVGALLLTFFIRDSWMADAAANNGGSWTVLQQLGVQAGAVLITIIFATIMTFILIVLVEKTIGFRAEKNEEMAGLDHSQHGEHGYGLINLNS